MFKPKLFTTLKDYTLKAFLADSSAGIVVGIVAIPLAIAFAIASGVSPEKGLVTAIVAGLLISIFGGSRVQIGGPTGAFVVIVYGIVAKYGLDGLIIATFIAGILLIAMGLAKVGSIIKFIPHSVIVGFTSGIAVIIFSSQIKDFLGLRIDNLPAGFIEKWHAIFSHIDSVNLPAVFIAVLTVMLLSFWPKAWSKVPAALVAIIISSLSVFYFKLPVETIGSKFGELPHGLPMPHLPVLDITTIRALFQPAFTIALLGSIESLLSAVVADGMIGSKHRSNTELIGQGIANIGSSLFGGIPATGAIARTATNIKNGGRTPIAGIIHAITVLAALILFGRFIKLVPLACLAGILVVIAYNMSEWRSIREIMRSSIGAKAVLVTTFLITVIIDLPAAIEVGVLLSAVLFIKRMSDATKIRAIADEMADDDAQGDNLSSNISVPAGVQIYEINGPLFFGAANKFEEIDRIIGDKPKARVLMLKNVTLIDSTGMHALKSFYKKSKAGGIHIVLAGLHSQPLSDIVKSELYDMIGKDNIIQSLNEAVEHAKKLIK